MRKRLTKKDRFFNDINFTADDDIYVGIDSYCFGVDLCYAKQRDAEAQRDMYSAWEKQHVEFNDFGQLFSFNKV